MPLTTELGNMQRTFEGYFGQMKGRPDHSMFTHLEEGSLL